MSNLDALDDRVRELAGLRQQLSLARQIEADYISNFMQTELYMKFLAMQETRKRIEAQMNTAEEQVRQMAVVLYGKTGEKKFPGVSIKEYVVSQYDEAQAID